ncbi:unnamed protein product, partial [Gulo gulo]
MNCTLVWDSGSSEGAQGGKGRAQKSPCHPGSSSIQLWVRLQILSPSLPRLRGERLLLI